MSSLRILITGNCLRYDIAAQLSQWLPDLHLVTAPLPDAHEPSAPVTQSLRDLLAQTDLWLTMGSAAATQKVLAGMTAPHPTVCRIPVIGFAAFHPDVCFAVNTDTGKATRQVFNSAIGVWAYRQGMHVSDAAALFNTANFRALGYINAWEPSVAYLREAFATSDLAEDFAAFFYAVKRDGCFMYTFNHPTPAAIARLCALICARCDLQALSDKPLAAGVSPASRLIWPIYPEIAHMLGMLDGGYEWHLEGQRIDGLAAFLTHAFDAYTRQNISPEALHPLHRDLAQLDRVLGGRGVHT